MPTRTHDLPAVSIESRQTFRSQALPHGRPQLFLVLAGVKCPRELGVVGADVPEEDPKGVDIDRVVIGTTEEFRRHVDGRSYDGARHHRLGFTETKICECTSVGRVKL